MAKQDKYVFYTQADFPYRVRASSSFPSLDAYVKWWREQKPYSAGELYIRYDEHAKALRKIKRMQDAISKAYKHLMDHGAAYQLTNSESAALQVIAHMEKLKKVANAKQT